MPNSGKTGWLPYSSVEGRYLVRTDGKLAYIFRQINRDNDSEILLQ